MYKRLVLQGGGAKGIGLLGALNVLVERRTPLETIIGCSAGAIVGALYASGYKPIEIKEILLRLNFADLLDGGMHRLPFKRGIYKGEKFKNWLEGLLIDKNIVSFQDIKEKNNIDFQVIATDISNRKPLLFPRDVPTVSVAEAVRMSISIPFVFDPVPLGSSQIVDGGVFSNFPLFFLPSDADASTIGIRLLDKKPNKSQKNVGIRGYIFNIVGTMLDSHDNIITEGRPIDLVEIDTHGISSTDFDITAEQKNQLFVNGESACLKRLMHRTDNSIRIKIRSEPAIMEYSLPLEVEAATVKRIRCSMSGLVKIECDRRYFLVRSRRRPTTFQPVGGVFKYNRTGLNFLDTIEFKPDTKIMVDEDSESDLRINIPKEKLNLFLAWFLSRKGREVTPNREFEEEVFCEGGLDRDVFKFPHFEWSHTCVNGLSWSKHFSCWELKVADVFTFEATARQREALRQHCKSSLTDAQSKFLWVTEEDIRRGGWQDNAASRQHDIGDHSEWIFEP